ncbi:MAG: GNAT family N-acetyltransferase [Chloroflexi bacterium]|nr:GNAT family N-acetyltransferase [Chloroflexota bacterium]
MDVQIKEVTTLKELRLFIHFPFDLYRGNPNWVPTLLFDELNTLRQDKNPAFEHCQARTWLAYRDGRIVGRVAAILNRRHIEKWGQRYMRFGWIDFIDDPSVSEALMNTVEAWAKEAGMTAVHGPLGFTDLDREGMLVEGFDELGTLATLYNHPYYPKHMEKLGYVKDTDWMEYEFSVPPEPNETIARIADIALRRNKLKLLELHNKKELLLYARELFQLLDDEYKHLYGVVPLTEKQIEAYIDQYFGFVTPDFVPMVMDQNNRMVAFGIVMPSLSLALQKTKGQLFPFGFIYLLRALKKNDRADLYLVAVRSEYQGKGVNAILMNKMHGVFNKLGITKVESNPELETNQNVQRQWKYYEKRQHKRRRVFIKHFSA